MWYLDIRLLWGIELDVQYTVFRTPEQKQQPIIKCDEQGDGARECVLICDWAFEIHDRIRSFWKCRVDGNLDLYGLRQEFCLTVLITSETYCAADLISWLEINPNGVFQHPHLMQYAGISGITNLRENSEPLLHQCYSFSYATSKENALGMPLPCSLRLFKSKWWPFYLHRITLSHRMLRPTWVNEIRSERPRHFWENKLLA